MDDKRFIVTSEHLEQIDNKSIQRISENPHLEKLTLRAKSLEGLDFSPLKQLENLKHLYLRDFAPLTALSHLLANAPKLEYLAFSNAGPFSTELLKEIARLGFLQTLFIQYCSGFQETSLLLLGNCTTLERVSFIGLGMASIDFEFVTRLTSLEKIICDYNEITDCDLRPLAQNKNLSEESLNGNGIETLDLGPFSSCKKLNILSLRSNRLQELSLTPLAQCDMTKLVFARNQLQRINLGPLAECFNLEKIFLFDNRLEEIDLSPLSKCKNLTFIDISDNRLRSIDLTPLSECHRLKTLKLHDNPVRGLDTSPIDSLESLTDFRPP